MSASKWNSCTSREVVLDGEKSTKFGIRYTCTWLLTSSFSCCWPWEFIYPLRATVIPSENWDNNTYVIMLWEGMYLAHNEHKNCFWVCNENITVTEVGLKKSWLPTSRYSLEAPMLYITPNLLLFCPLIFLLIIVKQFYTFWIVKNGKFCFLKFNFLIYFVDSTYAPFSKFWFGSKNIYKSSTFYWEDSHKNINGLLEQLSINKISKSGTFW